MKKLLIISDGNTDLSETLGKIPESVKITFEEAMTYCFDSFDSFYICGMGKIIDARLRDRLENEYFAGKRFFLENVPSWLNIYSADPTDTTKSRLICATDEIDGLEIGDLLDDEANGAFSPYCMESDMTPILVYKEFIIAHTHLNEDKDEIIKDSRPGMWKIGDNLIMTSFTMCNFNKAMFSPYRQWGKLVKYLAGWLTDCSEVELPNPVRTFLPEFDYSDDSVFYKLRENAVKEGIEWLSSILVDDGKGGILEGLNHNISPEGKHKFVTQVRTDCSGEAAGAFTFASMIYKDIQKLETSRNLSDYVFGPMIVKDGIFAGMMRWTESAWGVCYQDDVSRAILPELYQCVLFGKKDRINKLEKVLDFLVNTTAKDGTRVARTDRIALNSESLKALSEAEHGLPSAHYNAYYLASLLLGYRCIGKKIYLDTAERGLEYMMSLYPETRREQSETEEQCRLVLPLAILYETTGKEKHLEFLTRITDDLSKVHHKSGGYCEWDTGYKANCSRMSRGECSVLTENGDPIADFLYSTNWLPLGFAWAYKATGDERYNKLWREVSAFFICTQSHSEKKIENGCWFRAFDMDLHEVYAAPHDAGWGPNASESGWTDSEIIMGLLAPDIFALSEKMKNN